MKNNSLAYLICFFILVIVLLDQGNSIFLNICPIKNMFSQTCSKRVREKGILCKFSNIFTTGGKTQKVKVKSF